MITLEPINCPAFIVRLVPGTGDGAYPKFVASGVLEMGRQAEHIATMKALIGAMTPALKRELVARLLGLGIEDLRSIRAEGHSLPFSRLLPDGYLSTDLLALDQRFQRTHRSTP